MKITSNFEQFNYTENNQSRLFFALAEQLKFPFLQIARSAEALIDNNNNAALHQIEEIADMSMHLIDSFLLNIRLHEAGSTAVLQPVSLSAVLYDVAHKMEKIAGSNGCDLELQIAGKYGPIMAHPNGLTAALTNLSHVFINTQTQRTNTKRPVITLAAHRTRNGITAGLFSEIEGLNSDTYRRAKKIYGSSHQPLSQFTAHNGAGVFIADSLLETMSSGLRIARHHKMTGLAATFTPSQQMVLI